MAGPAPGVGSRLRLLSAAGQRIAPAGSTYGYDVVVRTRLLAEEGIDAPPAVEPRRDAGSVESVEDGEDVVLGHPHDPEVSHHA